MPTLPLLPPKKLTKHQDVEIEIASIEMLGSKYDKEQHEISEGRKLSESEKLDQVWLIFDVLDFKILGVTSLVTSLKTNIFAPKFWDYFSRKSYI